MQFTFEANLDYQLKAINSVVSLFEGQPKEKTLFNLNPTHNPRLINSVSNRLSLTSQQILTNLNLVQQENKLPISEELNELNFTIEMETGTGKTYVYLRTIYELNKMYGFTKFVIVVPSIAIREGVKKSLQITHNHLQAIYDKPSINYHIYDGGKVSQLREFATNSVIEILVINIDSFAKDENIINKPNDKLNGYRPIEFIQVAHPIVIIDEPQNMETEKRHNALKELNPLCMLRYSATHKNKYNLIYSLNPVDAYDLGLVKQIEVDSIIEENSFNNAYIHVEDIIPTKSRKDKVIAKIIINYNADTRVMKKTLKVKVGDDLYFVSNKRDEYKSGYIINELSVTNGYITLSSGEVVYKGSSLGTLKDDIVKLQIRKTIMEHLNKELKFYDKGIKVLSLFFIDKVANYRQYDNSGNQIPGKFALWFEEMYNACINQAQFSKLKTQLNHDPAAIHDGYFSSDKNKIKDTKGNTKLDYQTYELIMQNKEQLLNIKEPKRFIFSHSALREGWDNPNVFQICTLNETHSEIKKRQELGRGLRLCVNQSGSRIYDRDINRLTVIANESYDCFAKALQSEIEEDCGVNFIGRIKNAKDRVFIKYRKGFKVDPQFLELWNKIKYKTTYKVNYSTDDLITNVVIRLSDIPAVKSPNLISTKVSLSFNQNGINTSYNSTDIEYADFALSTMPNILQYIQNKTKLTNSTIFRILQQSGRIKELLINPQLCMDTVVQAIKIELDNIMVNGIEYTKIGQQEYQMALLDKELEAYVNKFSFYVNNTSKTIYENIIPLDSNVENQFAKDCETSTQVEFYFKLPSWFKIPTPIGNYNPDWAIVYKNDSKIYFIAETKNTGGDNIQRDKLYISEQLKIKCAEENFKQFQDINYKVVKELKDLKNK